MTQRLMKMYSERLNSLSQTLGYLHEIVGVDEALALLNDQALIQYKIDRVEQIVRDVLSSEKEKIIIQLILKIEAMQAKGEIAEPRSPQADPPVDQSHLLYFRKRLQQKNEELEKVKAELSLFKEQTEEQKRLITEQRMQFELYQNKHREIKLKCEMLEQQKLSEIKVEAAKSQNVFLLNRQLQEEVRRLTDAEKASRITQSQLKSTIDKLSLQNERLSSQIEQKRDFSCKEKLERVDNLKRQIRNLNTDLSEMREMIQIIQHFFHTALASELKHLKVQLKKCSNYMTSELAALLNHFTTSYLHRQERISVRKSQQEEHQKESAVAQIEKDDDLMKRMQTLEGELNRFIQGKLG